ncbi:MAG: NUDIX hydrolase [Sumerlaeia bacterium]
MAEPRTLYEAKHLKLIELDGWEFAMRAYSSGVVAILAVTPEREIVLVEQLRKSVGRRCIEVPAGLAGDTAGSEEEAFEKAALRELEEETGYAADSMEFLTAGPSSAGISDEVIHFYRAVGVRRVGDGGGDEHEDIAVHVVPLAEVFDWLADRYRQGLYIDPKVYTALAFAK